MLYIEKFSQYGWNIVEWLLRIVVATLCGALIGFERSKRLKEAGVRTHSVVALASAVFMIISKYAFIDMTGGIFGAKEADPSRIASTIVTGIGFLGAGAIFRTGNLVKGLTTAAGIFATAAVGMSVGSGLYVIGIFATALILLVHFIMHKVQLGRDKAVFCELTIKINDDNNRLEILNEFAKNNNIELEEQELVKDEVKGTSIVYEAKFFGKDAENNIAEMEQLLDKENFKTYVIKRL